MNFLQFIIYYISIALYNIIVNRKIKRTFVLFYNVSRETFMSFFLFIIRKERRRKMIYAITGGFIVLDMITGMIKAFKEKAFTSSVMREGLFHKCGSILTIVFGVLVDYAQKFIDLGVEIPIALSLCIYIILMECGSIAENVGKINPAIVPQKIKSHFSKLSERSDND